MRDVEIRLGLVSRFIGHSGVHDGVEAGLLASNMNMFMNTHQDGSIDTYLPMAKVSLFVTVDNDYVVNHVVEVDVVVLAKPLLVARALV